MSPEVICIVVTALAWGAYPLVARASGVGASVGALILTVSALLPLAVITLWQGVATRPTAGQLGKLLVAGMLMGIGTAAFNFVANSRALDASISIPIIDTAMLLVTALAAIFFFAEPITAKKIVGMAFLIAGIAILNRA